MKLFYFVAIFSICLFQFGWAQDNAVNVKEDLYENSLEKKYLTQYQNEPFLLLQALDAQSESSIQTWQKVTTKLDKDRRTNSKRFLKQLYLITQQHLLKDYTLYASFSKTLDEGRFDCVTGTAAYALLLEKYDIFYQVIMTGQHVYIKGNLGGIPFIIESTFAVNGLAFGKEAVDSFESKIIFNDLNKEVRIPYVVGSPNNFNSEYEIIGLRELAGLQYYNDAIKKFHEEDYYKSYIQLMKAEFLYPSKKISALKLKMELLLSTI